MAQPNPAISPPPLVPRFGIHSRSPSRSPVRRARDRDPLLRDLSPTKTLRAFTDEPAVASAQSTETASASERALGAKAAQTCISLRTWCQQLESWDWPGTFEMPEPARKKLRMNVEPGRTLSGHSVSERDEDPFWGSLPASTVLAHDQRVGEISRDLDAVDVEELKQYALASYQRSGSAIDNDFGNIGPVTDLRRLDDYTALITATILQTLPYLTRLHRLLDLWTMRFSILQQTPAYLHDLEQAQTNLDQGWAAIAASATSGQRPAAANFTRETMYTIRSDIQKQVSSLGRRLDSFLDELEGSDETVPEAWIEDFERLETAYCDWVVQAERKVLENEWQAARKEERKQKRKEDEEPQDVKGTEDKQSSVATAQGDHKSRDLEPHAGEGQANGRDVLVSPPLQSPGGTSISPHKESEGAETKIDINSISRDDAEAEHGQLDAPGVLESQHNRPAKHVRHVPIVIDYEAQRGRSHVDKPALGSSDDSSELPQPPSSTVRDPALSEIQATSFAKRRAAFLNGEIERTRSLQKQVKSPVRSFEHASNAFTRLFKRDKSPEHSRSNSQKSNTSSRSLGSRRSLKGSKDGDGDGPTSRGHRRVPSISKNAASVGRLSRPRSQSQHSFARDRASKSEARKAAPLDYLDLPGGFYPKSQWEDVRRAKVVIPAKAHNGEERRSRPSKPPVVETYKPKRLKSPFRPPRSRQHQEPEYPPNWPLAPPSEAKPISPADENTLTSYFDGVKAVESDRMEKLEAARRQDDEDSGFETKSAAGQVKPNAVDHAFTDDFPTTLEFDGNPLGGGSLERESTSDEDEVDEMVMNESVLDLDDAIGEEPLSEATEPMDMETHTTLGQRTLASTSPSVLAEAEVLGSTDGQHLQAQSASRYSNGQSPNPYRSSSPPSGSSSRRGLDTPSSQLTGELIDEDKASRISQHSRQASTTSIESAPRGEIQGGESPSQHGEPTLDLSVPPLPGDQSPADSTAKPGSSREGSTSPLSYKGLVVFPRPPLARRPSSPTNMSSNDDKQLLALPTSKFASLASDGAADSGFVESPRSERSDDSPARLNVAMPKRKHKDAGARSPSSPSTKSSPSLKRDEDSFDRHVSEVIERLPSAAIKFKSRPGVESPVPRRTAEPRHAAGPRPKNVRVSSRASPSDLTLAPAELSPKKSAAESEVKLYHLTQAGRDEPIKLFVRIVGDGERVMVRVGGGWADLADHLRQYAEHHGSRTVSGGGLQVQTADRAGPSRRHFSSSSTGYEGKARSMGTPGATTPRAGSRLDSRADDDWLSQPQPIFSMGDSTPTDEESPVGTPASGPTTTTTTTPHRTGATVTPKSTPPRKPGSRPSTAEGTRQPSGRPSWKEAGLAGPASTGKRADLPEQKAKWVEGMIEKAKASAEKNKEEKAKYFGDLGKAGGTRRVVFRSGSGVNGNSGGGS